MKTKLLCEYCLIGYLSFVNADEPYSCDHYQCDECDSTFPIENKARMASIDYWIENTDEIYRQQKEGYHVSSVIIDAFEAGWRAREAKLEKK